MADREVLAERRYDWRRVEQWENLNARGFEGNARRSYFHTVQQACKRLYKEHRFEPNPTLNVELNDWRYLLLACQLIDDDYEKYKEAR